MKKLITLCLALAGMVWSADATNNVTIYFQPNSAWADAGARFIGCLYSSDGTEQGWVSFDAVTGQSGYYSANIDTDATPKIIFVRKKAGSTDLTYNDKWGQTPTDGHITLPTSDACFHFTGTKTDDADYNISLVPWRYYLYGGAPSTTWCVGSVLTSNGNVHTASLDGMAGKNFIVFNGSEINYDNGLIWNNDTWNNAIRPATSLTINFESYSNLNTIKGGQNNWWYPTTNEGDVQFSYDSNANTYSISCTKTVSIGDAGYATYSNGEKYSVEDAEKIYVATNVGKNTVTMTMVNPSTVFGENAGIILKGSGDVTINAVASDATVYSGSNLLVGSGNNSLYVDNVSNAYVFSWDGSDVNSVGFYAVSEEGRIGAHKAYLNVPTSSRSFLSFQFDDATGISDVKAAPADNAIYNLQGVRMNQFQKGLNIVNGKKILVK